MECVSELKYLFLCFLVPNNSPTGAPSRKSTSASTLEATAAPTSQPTAAPTSQPTHAPSTRRQQCTENSIDGTYYPDNCIDPDGCVFILDPTIRTTNAACDASCTAGYSGSVCYGCLYNALTSKCVLLLGKPFAAPCVAAPP